MSKILSFVTITVIGVIARVRSEDPKISYESLPFDTVVKRAVVMTMANFFAESFALNHIIYHCLRYGEVPDEIKQLYSSAQIAADHSFRVFDVVELHQSGIWPLVERRITQDPDHVLPPSARWEQPVSIVLEEQKKLLETIKSFCDGRKDCLYEERLRSIKDYFNERIPEIWALPLQMIYTRLGIKDPSIEPGMVLSLRCYLIGKETSIMTEVPSLPFAKPFYPRLFRKSAQNIVTKLWGAIDKAVDKKTSELLTPLREFYSFISNLGPIE
ncbi:uncharacterized protein BXIN_1966 [Babesia sp. Xinjiang]|uniref:uncharacterized protein n=1 Tax=Babesia sp. Xinjiang TaxID=462227 RepID=UPI000A24E8B1|nr:uncharacterized protein BXIN_1966 [Babesia sp. Xinjiang]ORM40546.1 hypothetical protein BXIN_1966 [Babesia sp. Xinjiang]